MNQNFSYLLVRQRLLNLQKQFHNTSCNLANYYDTLKLQRSCTSKQIRDSFIKLSKENHPDINKSPNAHKEFLKIQEAYNVLSKPGTRASYDLGLSNSGSRVRHERSTSTGEQEGYGPYQTWGPRYTTPPYGRNPWDDPYFYHNRDRSQDAYNKSQPYYGIKGINKVSNGTVAFYIVAFAAVMFVLQILAIRHTVSIQQDIMMQRSGATQRLLNEIKERAERNGNEAQIEIHRKQFEEMDRLRAESASRQT